jgi:hypothetical protein
MNDHKRLRARKASDLDRLYKILAMGQREFGVCVHEAGHAVVGVCLGQRLESLSIYRRRGCLVGLAEFSAKQRSRSRTQRRFQVEALRKLLAKEVAGHVAETLWEELDIFRHFPSAAELRRAKKARCGLVSQRIDPETWPCDPLCDEMLAVDTVRSLRVLTVRKESFSPEAFLPEMRRAERLAERILKSNWIALRWIAYLLATREGNRVTGAEVSRIVAGWKS